MKFITTILILFIGSFTAMAQFNLGVRAGYTISKVSGDWDAAFQEIEDLGIDLDLSPKFKGGFYAGLFTEFALSEKFMIQPEIIYSMKGVKFEDEFDLSNGLPQGFFDVSGNFLYTQVLNYLDLNVMAKYKSPDGITLSAGPFVSYLVSTKGEFEAEVNYNTNLFGTPFSGSQPISGDGLTIDDFNRIDFGISGGLGYEFPFNLGIEARFVKGLLDINNTEMGDGAFTNTTLQFGLKYKFLTK